MKTDREITIYDIAKALDLNPSTVSRALKAHPHIKKETARKILATAERMGYQRNKFASNLRLKQTNTLGLLVPKLNSYFMSTVIAGIEKVTTENGYGLIISTSQESEKLEAGGVRTLFNSRVDGMMVSLAFDTGKLDHFNILFKKDIPVVFFDRVLKCPDCLNVVIDNYRAGFEVTSHLISQGCKRIIHAGGNMLRNVYMDRCQGYRKALDEAGIEFDDSWIIISDLSRQSGVEIAQKILKMEPLPDGVFAANDTSAVAIVMELRKHGINIPGDICVAGFNNEPLSQVISPNLTTVDYPAEEMGIIAATSLINKLRNRNAPGNEEIMLDHKLIIRESSLRFNSKSSSQTDHSLTDE